MKKRHTPEPSQSEKEPIHVERVQTGVRLEKRILKVLKTLAEYHDLTLGDLIEGIVLHVFDGKLPFNQANMERIARLKEFYGVTLTAEASHRLREEPKRAGKGRRAAKDEQ